MCNNGDNAHTGYDNMISSTFSVGRSIRHRDNDGSPTPAKPLNHPGEKEWVTGAARATRSKQTTVEYTT